MITYTRVINPLPEFHHVFTQVKEYIDSDMYKLCTEKLVEFNLTKEKGFVWCASVSTS